MAVSSDLNTCQFCRAPYYASGEPSCRCATTNLAPDQYGDATRHQSVQVDDLVTFADRCWQVTGVYLGAQHQESVATIVACDRGPAHVQGEEITRFIVPLPFLYGRIYRYVTPDRLRP